MTTNTPVRTLSIAEFFSQVARQCPWEREPPSRPALRETAEIVAGDGSKDQRPGTSPVLEQRNGRSFRRSP